jgi:hypothetical protein
MRMSWDEVSPAARGTSTTRAENPCRSSAARDVDDVEGGTLPCEYLRVMGRARRLARVAPADGDAGSDRPRHGPLRQQQKRPARAADKRIEVALVIGARHVAVGRAHHHDVRRADAVEEEVLGAKVGGPLFAPLRHEAVAARDFGEPDTDRLGLLDLPVEELRRGKRADPGGGGDIGDDRLARVNADQVGAPVAGEVAGKGQQPVGLGHRGDADGDGPDGHGDLPFLLLTRWSPQSCGLH